jgi:hypothetical protein
VSVGARADRRCVSLGMIGRRQPGERGESKSESLVLLHDQGYTFVVGDGLKPPSLLVICNQLIMICASYAGSEFKKYFLSVLGKYLPGVPK